MIVAKVEAKAADAKAKDAKAAEKKGEAAPAAKGGLPPELAGIKWDYVVI